MIKDEVLAQGSLDDSALKYILDQSLHSVF